MNFGNLLVMTILLGVSALFSLGEAAFFSLRETDLNSTRRRRATVDVWLLRLYAELPDLLHTILLGNLTINVAYFSLSATAVTELSAQFGNWVAAGSSALFLGALIVFGEVVPKNLGSTLNLRFAHWLTPPLFVLHFFFAPLRRLLRKITLYFERALFPPPPTSAVAENLRLLFEHYHREGVVSGNEYGFINAVLDLNMARVREVMTPRVEAVTIKNTATAAAVLDLAREKKHQRILVVDENERWLDFVDAREIFFTDAARPLANYRKPLLIVSEFASLEKSLRCLLNSEYGMAAVVDERGMEIGILVLTDIIAEIFGEFGSGNAPVREVITKDGDGSFLFDGRVAARELLDIFRSPLRFPGVSTIGGLVTALLGRTAKVGDCVEFNGVLFTVEKMQRRRPVLVRVISAPENNAESPSRE